ncbi:MAG: BrnA antitoxin family protein [Pseudomonadota bacterium]|nr:BrnA antitoxin family protein [Pseudomonadota bacterium]
MSKIVKRKVDMSKLPPLSAKQKAELKALATAPDEQIDYSDIPPLSSEFWKVAERGRFYKPVKKSTTVRVDADVLAWLKSQGKGYQTRINSILRNAMLRALGGRRSVR